MPDIAAAAAVIRAHAAMGLTSGLLVCNPVPEADALPLDVARAAIEQAIREADEAGISGAAVTPWLLARVAEITGGASVKANIVADHEQCSRRRRARGGALRLMRMADRHAVGLDSRGRLSPEPRCGTQLLPCSPCW